MVLCAPVVESTKEDILRVIKEMVEAGLPMLEWRMDFYRDVFSEADLEMLLDEIKGLVKDTVLLCTFRSKEQGGEKDASWAAYEALLKQVARSGAADLVDVEIFQWRQGEKILKELQEKGVRVVASQHDFFQTPSQNELEEIFEKMICAGADFAKVAVMPRQEEDVKRLMEVVAECKKKYPRAHLISMSMGQLGKETRLGGATYGSEVCFVTHPKASAPGQPTFAEARAYLQKNIFLIGFMGCGKSTIAGLLAEKTGYALCEMDEAIEAAEGCSIRTLFETKGEGYFRDRETAFLRTLSGQGPSVVSCGGGVAMRKENVSLMRQKGRILYLTATPQTILERVQYGKNRPLLDGKMCVEEIEALMEKREKAYGEASDWQLATDTLSPEELVEQIEKILKRD